MVVALAGILTDGNATNASAMLILGILLLILTVGLMIMNAIIKFVKGRKRE